MPWPTLNDPVHDSQRLFRQLLAAMSEPGTRYTLDAPQPPDGEIGPALWGTLLTLCDLDTRVWLAPEWDTAALREALALHTGSRVTECAEEADFALVTPDTMGKGPDFSLGSDEYPDRSTTLLVVLDDLEGAEEWRLSGPGIADCRVLGLGAAARPLMARLIANQNHFPRGLDTILTCGARLAAIPRSTRIEEGA
ncbi:phosphonate C-P lyase system protein PhnH [Halomonas salipaludis]|uniref:Phosphonate C-P lyase system protein PhnH n=1 Tax=Halomonas salipaludis TaxID=2032625 RepID=A0A2A2EY59_9GAMM|nr:phosphonate C-P lyase system protein PhnH [Halomonas salipaludis]PAU77297.1 phosphonate C-P lyase system protein PhnH [Halomonas salipaludis]